MNDELLQHPIEDQISDDENEHEERNEFGLEDEQDTNSTGANSETSRLTDLKKKWTHSEIISKLKSGDFKVK